MKLAWPTPYALSLAKRMKSVCVSHEFSYVYHLPRVLIKDGEWVLAPVAGIHRVVANQLELREAVIAVVGASGAVDDKGLASIRVGELLGAFIRRKTVVARAAKRCLLPRILRDRDDLALGEGRRDSPRVLHLGDAEIGRPAVVLAVPAAIDVIQLILVLEVGSVNRKLVVRVKLGLVRPLGLPWILTLTLDDEHAVVDGGAVVLAPHLHLRGRRIAARVGREDDIPVAVEVVDLGRPEIRRVVEALLGLEDELGLSVVPVSQDMATEERDVLVVGVGHVVVVTMAKDPAVVISLESTRTTVDWTYGSAPPVSKMGLV